MISEGAIFWVLRPGYIMEPPGVECTKGLITEVGEFLKL